MSAGSWGLWCKVQAVCSMVTCCVFIQVAVVQRVGPFFGIGSGGLLEGREKAESPCASPLLIASLLLLVRHLLLLAWHLLLVVTRFATSVVKACFQTTLFDPRCPFAFACPGPSPPDPSKCPSD